MSLYLCSSGSNARGESRALEGRRVSSKSPAVSKTRELLGGSTENCVSRRGVIDLPCGQISARHEHEKIDISLNSTHSYQALPASRQGLALKSEDLQSRGVL